MRDSCQPLGADTRTGHNAGQLWAICIYCATRGRDSLEVISADHRAVDYFLGHIRQVNHSEPPGILTSFQMRFGPTRFGARCRELPRINPKEKYSTHEHNVPGQQRAEWRGGCSAAAVTRQTACLQPVVRKHYIPNSLLKCSSSEKTEDTNLW